MKVSAEHLANMRAAIEPLDTDETRERYRQGNFPRADRVKNLDMRYRWDLLWSSGAYGEEFDGYKNDHIDTALRAIVPTL